MATRCRCTLATSTPDGSSITTRLRTLNTLPSTWNNFVPCSSSTSKSSPMLKNRSRITYMQRRIGAAVPGRAHGHLLRLEHDLDAAVLLLLEDLVRVRRLLERHPVRRQVVHAQRVVVAGQQRHDVVHPALDVRLAHPHRDALVEEI